MNINPNEMTLDQLKIMFYDELKKFEIARQNIEILKQVIDKKESEAVPPSTP